MRIRLKSLILLCFSSVAMADFGFMEMSAPENIDNNIKSSKWLFDFGVRYIDYPVQLTPFEGEHVSIKSEEKFHMFNAGFGLGREFYIGSGFSFSLKLGGILSSNTDSVVGNAAEDLDYEVSTSDKKYKYTAGELSASVNYVFQNKVISIQPFAEFGVGSGKSEFDRLYNDKGVDDPDAVVVGEYKPQNYTASMTNSFTYTRIAVGVNFISNYRLSSYIRLSKNFYDNSDSTFSGSTLKNEVSSTLSAPAANSSVDVISSSLGVTYAF